MFSFLNRKVGIASLVFFRIVFGFLAFADVLNTWVYHGLMKGDYAPDRYRFSYIGFEWVKPFPEPLLSIFFVLLMGAAIFIIIGKWYRWSALFFAVGFTYVFLLEKAFYLNHGYLFCWISWIMVFLPVHRAFSTDVWKTPALYRRQIPYWCLFVLQFLMGVVYFYGGIAKLNADWLHAMPLKLWLPYKSGIPLIGPLLKEEWTAYFMAYGGLILDLFIVPLLIFRTTRPWVFGFAVFFHLTNNLVFSIGIFPYLSLSLTALYFSPDFPRRIIGWLQDRWAWVAKIKERWSARTALIDNPLPLWQESHHWRPVIYPVLTVIVVFHLLVPFRHHLFRGDVAWTEEGHRYSWRMMLRAKQGKGKFVVRLPGKDKNIKIDPGQYLSAKQERKLYTHPDMIWQFAQFLHDKHKTNGDPVEVYAHIRTRLNDKPYQQYIDTTVNLAAEKWYFFRESEWIVPPQH